MTAKHIFARMFDNAIFLCIIPFSWLASVCGLFLRSAHLKNRVDIAKYGSLYKFIDNGGICIYCGIDATSKDHFLPISVMGALQSAILHKWIEGGFLVPSCGQCNSIAGNKIFNTVARKRRYIQTRLARKYKDLLNSPFWTEEELLEMGYSLAQFMRSRNATREWVKRRIEWRNSRNPSSVKLAEIRLKYGVFGKSTVRPGAKTKRSRKKEITLFPNTETA